MRTLRRIAKSVALPVAAGAAIASLPATAQAAEQSVVVTVCSRGSFYSLLEFPQRGGLQTVMVGAGSCLHWTNLGGSGVEQVNVHGGGEYIASFQWDSNRSVTVNTVDTASGKSFYLS